MHYHMILTELCNSECKYCYGKSMCEENDLNKRFKFDFEAPYVSEVSTGKIRAFLMKDAEPKLVFYGGEPLLQIDRIKELIDALADVPSINFRMQTNGKLLDKLDINYLKKISKILVSIDGTRARTDFNKGNGTYDKVIRNLLAVRNEGYDGEIVARMAVSDFTDVYEQTMHLIRLTSCNLSASFAPPSRPDNREQFLTKNSRARDQLSQKAPNRNVVTQAYLARELSHHHPEPRGVSVFPGALPPALKRVGQEISDKAQDLRLFDSIHWQLDVGFYKCDYDYARVKAFVSGYNASITKLFEWWMGELREGKVWKLYPFIGMVEHLLSGREAKLMCGAGHSGYTITTDGNLVACPIMGCMPDFYCGTLDSSPTELKKIGLVSRCASCGYLRDCGGRCLYVNSVELWPSEGMELICSTVRHYVDLIKSKIGEIRRLIDTGILSEKDFEYEKYFGPEIVP